MVIFCWSPVIRSSSTRTDGYVVISGMKFILEMMQEHPDDRREPDTSSDSVYIYDMGLRGWSLEGA